MTVGNDRERVVASAPQASPPADERAPRRRNRALAAFGCLWLAAAGVVAWRLQVYDATPGRMARPPAHWPAGSAVARAGSRPTLLMFVHPQCACSSASLEELSRLMARAGAPRPAVAVLFLAPGTESRDWWHGDLWRSATAIPGVRVLGDVDGRERSRFGAFTSGQAMLYGATGELLFSGGITPARCRAGDNPGRRAVAERLRAWPSSEGSTAAVFGCSLVADEPPDTGG